VEIHFFPLANQCVECVDVLMTVLICWYVDDCVDVLMTVLICWYVDDCVDVLSVSMTILVTVLMC
jgi:hypothetical protein